MSETNPNTTQVNIGNQSVEAETVTFGDSVQHNITTYNYTETNPSFTTIDFEDEEFYPAPLFTKVVVDMLLKNRIIIIKGNNHFDQISFSKQVAQLIQTRSGNLKTRELVQNEEDKALFSQLMLEGSRQIVLLNAIHPRHLNYDFTKLLSMSESKQSYYIINTDSSHLAWTEMTQLLTDYWYEVPPSEHYDKTEMLNWFMERISDQPPLFLAEEDEILTTTRFSETKVIEQVVMAINTPQNLKILLEIFRFSDQLPSDKKLLQTIGNLGESQEEIITKWFNNLNHDQKIIALSAALFNGLYCNQYFEILNELISTTFWKQSSTTLEALDYFSLDFLNVFFRYETTIEGTIIVARNQTTRVHLLKTAIHQYQRHIEKALEIFSTIMQTTYKRKISNWDLYGTTQKRALLRQVFIESTRDIGINSLSNIESVYLELAASDHSFIQRIAAKSLAQYRLFDKDELLFSTIDHWLTNTDIEERIAILLRTDVLDKIAKEKIVRSIKSTTIRALAHAADYDKPNKLHERIGAHLIKFATDPDTLVQKAVADELPKFIHHHSYQLRNEIFDNLMPKAIYGKAISDGLMLAYQDYPDSIKNAINHWLSICTKEVSQDNRRNKTTFRDNTLLSLLETLEKINLTPTGGYTVIELYAIAVDLLKMERRNDVIQGVLRLISHLQAYDYALAFDYIPSTLSLLTTGQRDEMIKLWLNHYLVQRQNLTNPSYRLIINGANYPVWDIPKNRPLTEVEETLFLWINTGSKVAKQFATLVFLEIARSFEDQEFKAILNHRIVVAENERLARERRRSNYQNIQITTMPVVNPGLGFWLNIKIFFYLLFENKENRLILKDLIKLFQAGKYSKRDLDLVIYKWEFQNRGELSTKLAKWLTKLMNTIKS